LADKYVVVIIPGKKKKTLELIAAIGDVGGGQEWECLFSDDALKTPSSRTHDESPVSDDLKLNEWAW
jgi:hypothetical protein